MRHRVAGKKLNRSSDHRRALFRNLVSALIYHERIETTQAKAEAIRPHVEKLITLAKRGLAAGDSAYGVHARRLVAARINRWVQTPDGERVDLVQKLFDEIAPRYRNRPGGYTRIVKLGPRKGDGAPMAIIELV